MWLLKAGGCLIHFIYRSQRILGQLSSGCLIQASCLIEVTTNTGLTVYWITILTLNNADYQDDSKGTALSFSLHCLPLSQHFSLDSQINLLNF